MKHICLFAAALIIATGAFSKSSRKHHSGTKHNTAIVEKPGEETVAHPGELRNKQTVNDSVPHELPVANRSGRLSEQDFKEVAEELGVEVAAIKAVVEIEAGKTHQGFWAEGKPIINFDLSMFRRMAAKNHISLGKYVHSHPIVFNRPSSARYGGQQAAVQARLDAARSIDNTSGIEGTFWGMFQIGGFNWRKCGAKSIDDFVYRMSRSERDQLELFANFVRNTGLLEPLKAKNWAAFARGYNGPSYASRRYHTRLASAYARHHTGR